jgi:hypothetical protein
LINRGQDDLEHAMRRAYHIGVKEGYQAQLEKEQEQRKLKKKRGWFWRSEPFSNLCGPRAASARQRFNGLGGWSPSPLSLLLPSA